MQTDTAKHVVETLLQTGNSNEIAEISGKLDQLIRLADETLHMQKVAALEPGNVLRFHTGLHSIALSLPDAQDDYIQRVILRRRAFYEAKLLSLIQTTGVIGPEVTVCDIGANIGNHSIFFGKVLQAKRVLAFEPLPHCYETLCRNLDLNGLSNALAYNCMVGAKSGRGDIARFNPRNLGSTVFVAAKNGPIPMVALDDLMDAEEMQGLGFIKVDVEGMQMDVLNGAKKLIKTFRPVMWIEILGKDKSAAATMKLMESLGYMATPIGGTNHLFTPKP
ncbi:MAG: FkbM family methyltransferase [Rhodobacteraceae bacterium]|nr:FkbM family methyltransferase [Paracoccaceae bacterium]MCF8515351.1 FkbM family methyltransferase [Paracoccaceae bacterium]MCF8519464.1 FkbM family methyltransferase [Paracoccaceae bacterium]